MDQQDTVIDLSPTLRVLIVGGSGTLGSQLVSELAKVRSPRIQISVLVRERGRLPFDEQFLVDKKISVYEGNLDDELSLLTACENQDVVVSTVQGDRGVIVNGQQNLLKACLEAKVTKFIPSDYCLDYFLLPTGINRELDWRKEFAGWAIKHKSELAVVHLLTGILTEAVFGFLKVWDSVERKFRIFSDPDTRFPMTSLDDITRFIVEAVLEPEIVGKLPVCGEDISFAEIAERFELVNQEKVEVVQIGDVSNLESKVQEMNLREEKDTEELIRLEYLLPIMKGEARFEELKNSVFTSFKPRSFEQWLMKHRI
ncbi:NAD(P)-binding protein [Basidiobolus meristosporus CBS 931.73]|uniref:NAD(P)-binding protein n=1 Tax=Basidiobolus meristosporus CBS 931.73 TaxID=1314790 RepID=A0A1Y1XXI4_9FUNG|nr:NAD(P)-binding protein [Basidiobolus meristosporus CBS 931.73]|eukprot:ORX90450.1 NAD(P)-binding protein [Basidiobolus meristosporus CBS 931.73]